jgi:plasmid segregation protein ParM
MTETNLLPDQAARVPTRSLPEGALFVAADGTIYQVVLAGSAGFRKAKRWGGSDREAVALVPDSPLTLHYPVVEHGTPLPRLTRADLTAAEGQTSHFTFPTEKLARAAAYLDEALAWQSGCMARKENQRWLLTDGLHQFRVYHYEKADDGRLLNLAARFDAENIRALSHTQGPAYWSYLPGAAGDSEPSAAEVKPATAPEPAAPTLAPVLSERPLRLGSRLNAQKGKKMILSVDIGYGYTKGVAPDGLRFSFPSVVGNAEEITFTSDLITQQAGPMVRYGGRSFFYGEQALLQSRLHSAIFDRSRIRDDTYRLLFASALAELARQHPDGASLNVITGLPVGFFSDRGDVTISLEGEYRLQLDDAVTFDVGQVFVVPQPFGSLFRELLNEDGTISNVDVEQGRVAVIDIGTYTTDFIAVNALRYIQRFSSSIPIGWSEVLSNLQRELSGRYRLDQSLHEVDQAMRSGEVRVKGQPINLQSMLAPAVRELEAAIVAKARDLWGEGVSLDALLITGGAAQHLAGALQVLYPQARLLPDAFWANAEGFYRFAQRPATFGEA